MPRNLVVCCDGTWKSEDDRSETNVVRLWRAVADRSADGDPQLKFYDRGVGVADLLDRALGGVTGRGLRKNVRDVYTFLATNYEPGDRIFLFGFSRGAFTARSAAGFIRKCGLLRASELSHLDAAFELYKRRDETADPPDVEQFRQRHSEVVDGPHFIGVWDTVGSLGLPFGPLRRWTARLHQFHDVRLSSRVRHAYQAVAIDERRTPFEPTLWEVSGADSQHVEQTWFVGVHSNVGGGYAGGVGLSGITLAWMAERAEQAGLALDHDVLNSDLAPNHAGSLGRAAWFYRVTRQTGSVREIGVSSPSTEDVHPTALERMDDPSLGYSPANLRAYLRKP